MTRVVLDTSVLVSAFLTERGTSHELLSAAQGGAFVLCLLREILEETRGALQAKVRTIRRYYAYPDERIDRHIADLATLAEHVTDLPELHAVPLDSKDDMVVATAMAAGADYLVTGDKRHLLHLGEYEGIRIVGVREFIDLLQHGAAGEDQ